MPNDYDKIIKENFEPLLPHLLRKIFGLELPKLIDLKDKIQHTVEREMDNLKKVVHEGRPELDFGLQWEIQTADEDMRARNLLYYGLFYQKHRLPLKQIVVYVGKEHPSRILQNCLDLEGLRLEFLVVDLKSVPKELFLQSETPEELVLAILSDFGSDQPETVIRLILQNLLKVVGRVPRLKKYQQQLSILSRLRKLEIPVKNEISAMPIHYDIQTDGLFLEGIEEGIQKGIEKGIERGKGVGITLEKRNTVKRMLQAGKFTLTEIAAIADVDIDFVLNIQQEIEQ